MVQDRLRVFRLALPGFLGETLRGPDEPRFITGFEEFKRLYGGHVPVDQSTLPFAIDGFFKNGGQRCFVARITSPNATPTTKDHDAKIRIRAIGPGVWGNRIAAKIEPATLQVPGELARFKLTVMYWDVKVLPPTDPPVDPTLAANITNVNRRDPTIIEVYDNLSVVSTSIDFFETTINGNSSLIRVEHIIAAGTPATAIADMTPLAMLTTDGTAGVNGAAVVRGDYLGRTLDTFPDDDTSYKTGLAGFEQIDEIAIVVAPDYHVHDEDFTDIITHCTKMRDRFAITHSNPADTLANIQTIQPPPDTTFAAFYFPWIKVYNPLTYQDSLVPPSGHIAGIYAKTDIERGVFKAPANEVVVGARVTSVSNHQTRTGSSKSERRELHSRFSRTWHSTLGCAHLFPEHALEVRQCPALFPVRR